MEIDTLILISLTSAAIGWYLTIRISETREYARELAKRERESLQRAKRVKELMGNKQP